MIKLDSQQSDDAVMALNGESPSRSQMPLTLGDYAYQVLEEQFNYILAQEAGVLKDKDPEYLHQMRVGIRRLRTALAVFSTTIRLPKKAETFSFKKLSRVLGNLRDLDVQIEALDTKYRNNCRPVQQQTLLRLKRNLEHQRKQAYGAVYKLLTKQRTYQQFKLIYQAWLDQPQYKPIALFPLSQVLPEILSPLLSQLLLHPAWLVPKEQVSGQNAKRLHSLRKLCKQVRYQGEFFQAFYPKAFKRWVKQVKSLQSSLGEFQDAMVFSDHLANAQVSDELAYSLDQDWSQSLSDWNEMRSQYLDPTYRRYLHELILSPKI